MRNESLPKGTRLELDTKQMRNESLLKDLALDQIPKNLRELLYSFKYLQTIFIIWKLLCHRESTRISPQLGLDHLVILK